MPEFFETVIRGNVVYRQRTSVTKVCSVKEFTSLLNKSTFTDTGWIPRGCVRFFSRGKVCFYLFEFPEKNPIFGLFGNKGAQQKDLIELRIPSLHNYFLFIVTQREDETKAIANIFFFTTAKPLRQGDQIIYRPLAPNLYDDGRVCTGTQALTATTIEGKIEQMLAQLVHGTWNPDLSELSPALNKIYHAKKEAIQKRREEWRKKSVDPNQPESERRNADRRARMWDRKLHKFLQPTQRLLFLMKTANEIYDKTYATGDREAFISILKSMDTWDKWLKRIVGKY